MVYSVANLKYLYIHSHISQCSGQVLGNRQSTHYESTKRVSTLTTEMLYDSIILNIENAHVTLFERNTSLADDGEAIFKILHVQIHFRNFPLSKFYPSIHWLDEENRMSKAKLHIHNLFIDVY